MARQQPRSLCFILNEKARRSITLQEGLTNLRNAGIRIDAKEIKRSGHPSELAIQACQEGFDAVVSCGGDGVLNEVVNGIMRCQNNDCAIGILPFGTANDFATQFDIMPTNLEQALRWLVELDPVALDVGQVNDRYFINVASGGFGAEISTETPRYLKDLMGGLAYTVTGVTKAFDGQVRMGRFNSHELKWEGALLLFCVSNGRQSGGGHQVAPKAKLNDGLLDIFLLTDPGLVGLPNLLDELLITGESANGIMRSWRTNHLLVETPVEIQVNVDGEPIKGTHFEFQIHPQRLQFLLPGPRMLREGLIISHVANN